MYICGAGHIDGDIDTKLDFWTVYVLFCAFIAGKQIEVEIGEKQKLNKIDVVLFYAVYIHTQLHKIAQIQ